MSPYMRRFIYASLAYLAAATIFGILNGTTDIGYLGQFAHSHFNLLGFMAMMVFGIGYFILPRFNGADLRFPSWVAVHFWLGNVSLVSLVAFRSLAVETGSGLYETLFVIAASVQSVTLFMFVINVWLSLSPKSQPVAAAPSVASSRTDLPLAKGAPARPAPQIALTAETRVAELVDLLPAAKSILVSAGLSSLALPGHMDKVRAMGVTLGMACRNHGLDFEAITADLQREVQRTGDAGSRPERPAMITGDAMIGEVLAGYPKARPLFQQHFGDGCFDCPGQAFESVEMACRMHGVEPERFLKELNQVLG